MRYKSFTAPISIGLVTFASLWGCSNTSANLPRISAGERDEYHAVGLKSEIEDSNSLIGPDPESIALKVFPPFKDQSVKETVTSENAANNQKIVFITRTGLKDDSVQAIRYRADFEPYGADLKQWRLIWAGRQYRCQSGRGSQNWSSNLCS
ncbi:MAG: hypothetical protein N5P05_001285 [Chroococcopsis gigantea SAG 12.99]|jgi:hypothetical protein|nr:hypothetical protein [Chlorogloea purpurea SAG 13.99]MDV2999679.1 hypothetical protein [Chroococcopsis gigantea SAG 12.99]